VRDRAIEVDAAAADVSCAAEVDVAALRHFFHPQFERDALRFSSFALRPAV
jgi:hypothetical protein